MLYLIVAAILLLGTIAAALFFVHDKGRYARQMADYETKQQSGRYYGGLSVPAGPAHWGVVLVPVVLLLAWTLIRSVTVVDARAVGIQTAFGKYVSTLDNGAHFIRPWSNTEEFTTRLQTGDLDGKEGVPVTFLGGGSGTVNTTFRWRIDDSRGAGGARALWENYRDFDTVQSSLVLRTGRDAVLNTANDYTPNDARTKQDIIAGQIKARLTTELGKYGVTVDSVSVLSMPLDTRTQASLDKIVAAQNDVERAKADNQRAKIDAETVQLRELAGALSPAANTRYCLDVVNNWDVAKNGQLPATFNCGLAAAGVPVIVGGGK